jgi:hypothetical protein
MMNSLVMISFKKFVGLMDLFVPIAPAKLLPINSLKINSNVRTAANKLLSQQVLFLIKQEPH